MVLDWRSRERCDAMRCTQAQDLVFLLVCYFLFYLMYSTLLFLFCFSLLLLYVYIDLLEVYYECSAQVTL